MVKMLIGNHQRSCGLGLLQIQRRRHQKHKKMSCSGAEEYVPPGNKSIQKYKTPPELSTGEKKVAALGTEKRCVFSLISSELFWMCKGNTKQMVNCTVLLCTFTRIMFHYVQQPLVPTRGSFPVEEFWYTAYTVVVYVLYILCTVLCVSLSARC